MLANSMSFIMMANSLHIVFCSGYAIYYASEYLAYGMVPNCMGRIMAPNDMLNVFYYYLLVVFLSRVV
jgi:hypothetical protein